MSVQAITAVRTGAEAPRASTAAPGGTLPTGPAQEARPEQEPPTRRAAATPADPPPDAQAAFATSQYLVQLLAVQTGGAGEHVARPARITPERLSALVEFLESHVSHNAAGTSRTSVDASA